MRKTNIVLITILIILLVIFILIYKGINKEFIHTKPSFSEFATQVSSKDECISGINLIQVGLWKPFNTHTAKSNYLELLDNNTFNMKNSIFDINEIKGKWEIKDEIIVLTPNQKISDEQLNLLEFNLNTSSANSGVVEYDTKNNSMRFSIGYESNGTKEIVCRENLYYINILGEFYYKDKM